MRRAGGGSTVRLAAGVVLVALLAAGCGGAKGSSLGGKPDVRSSSLPPGRMRLELIESGRRTALEQSIRLGAQEAAEKEGVGLIVRTPAPATTAVQANLLAAPGSGISAVIVVPIDYSQIVPAVRAAHDRGLPVVVVGPARPSDDQGLAWSFITSDGSAAGAAAADAFHQQRRAVNRVVLVASGGDEAGYEAGVRRAAHQLSLGVSTISTAAVDGAGGADPIAATAGIVAIGPDASATAVRMAAGRPVVAIGATRSEVASLKNGDVTALVSQQPRTVGSAALEAAINAGLNRSGPDQSVPCVVLDRAPLSEGTANAALYDG
jgi:ribose transport system substrate-binding protein